MPACPRASTVFESHVKYSPNWTRARTYHHGNRIHRPGENGLSDGPPPDRGEASAHRVRPAQGGGGQTGGAGRRGRIVTETRRRPSRDRAGEPAVAAGLARGR